MYNAIGLTFKYQILPKVLTPKLHTQHQQQTNSADNKASN